MNLRESKKQATREAISDAAAHILLHQGAEKLTVARVAAAAEISPRTFHNYFADLDAALLVFVERTFAEIGEDIRRLPPELGFTEAFERICLNALTGDGVKLHSASTLLLISERLELIGAGSAPDHAHVEHILVPLMSALQERAPELDDFEVLTILVAYGSAASLAFKRHMSSPDADGPALLRKAFDAVRASR